MEATIQNNETGATRKETVEPWTNYNVLVFDQRFGGNSSVTFVNTSTMRMGDFRDANATGLLWNIANKKNTYNYFGNFKGSWVRDGDTKFGNRGNLGIGKYSGKNRFEVIGNYVNKIGISMTLDFQRRPIMHPIQLGMVTGFCSRLRTLIISF